MTIEFISHNVSVFQPYNGFDLKVKLCCVTVAAQPHEGSCYSATKELQMAMHRSEHVKSRLAELDKLKQDHLRLKQQQQQSAGMTRSHSLPEQPPPR